MLPEGARRPILLCRNPGLSLYGNELITVEKVQKVRKVRKMEKRRLGDTDLRVSRLGVGLSELGDLSLKDVGTAARVLNTALDKGINFFDTAACYGNSEELVGRTVAERRDEYVLSTKAGHAVGDYDGRSWTAETVRHSIERSLERLRTDHLDVVHLHSCGIVILERGEVIRALQDAKQAGKTRYIGYSGDN